jgi:hypothetical protein
VHGGKECQSKLNNGVGARVKAGLLICLLECEVAEIRCLALCVGWAGLYSASVVFARSKLAERKTADAVTNSERHALVFWELYDSTKYFTSAWWC